MSSNISILKKCDHCGIEFNAKTLYTRYCSHTCNRLHYKKTKREEKIQSVQASQSKPDNSSQSFISLIQDKEFLSIAEASKLIGTSKRTIQRLISKDVIKVAKFGRRTIIQRKTIDNLFK